MVLLVAALAVVCLGLALECDAQRRRARFWKGAYERQHELHMRHLQEETELAQARTRLLKPIFLVGRVWN